MEQKNYAIELLVMPEFDYIQQHKSLIREKLKERNVNMDAKLTADSVIIMREIVAELKKSNID